MMQRQPLDSPAIALAPLLIPPADPPVRWGILSTARITRRWLPALAEARGARLEAVASRDAARGEAAAREWGCRAHAGYEALLADPQIDAVYIPLPNGLHAEWAARALRAGKMVVCEKSLVATPEHLSHLRRAVVETGGWLEESFQNRHHPLFDWARREIREGLIGRPRRSVGHFQFELNDADNIRWDRALGGGASFDLGCYTVGIQRLMLGEEPDYVEATAEWHESPTGPVDVTLEGRLEFPSGAHGISKVSFRKPFNCQWAIIGEEGAIHSHHDFAWSPKDDGRQSLTWTRFRRGEREGGGGQETVIAMPQAYDSYTNMVEECSARWRQGLPPRFGIDEAERNLNALWAMLESARHGGETVEVGVRATAADEKSGG